MTINEAVAYIAILVCTTFNFFFSLAETALVSCRTSRLEQALDKLHEAKGTTATDDPRFIAIQGFLREPTRIVAAVQIGLTTMSLTAAAVAVGVLGPRYAHMLHAHHVPHPYHIAAIALIIVVALLTLVVGEIVPRAVAQKHAERTALLVALPLRYLEIIETPIIAVVLGLSNAIVKPFGLTASFAGPVITEDELKNMLDTSQEEGVIEEDEKEMLRNVITFGDTLVHEVMTPRIDMKSAEATTSLPKLVNLIVDCGHTRIPIFEGSVDNIIGIIHAKDLLPAFATGKPDTLLKSLMRKIEYVPENRRVDELLEYFRENRAQIAIVQDEYGGTAGLVTIEDLLEEIVGDIQDEYDVELPKLVEEEDGSWEIDARLHIDDVNEDLDLDLPTEDFDTVGGFVFGLMGHMPEQGESVEHDGWKFTVTEADGRRVYRLRVSKLESVAAEED